MSQFVKKASSKIDKLSNEEILRIIDSQNSELRVRNAVLDGSMDGYLLTDKNLRILYCNQVFSEITPVSKKKKYTDLPVAKVVLDSALVSFMQAFPASGKASDDFRFETEAPGKGQRWVLCHASKLNEAEDCLFTFRDVTFLQRFMDEFRKNESLAQMTTMAAGVAHEIKNPLASISIYLQLLDKVMEKNGSLSREEAHKYLDIVQEEVDRINAITVDFLFAVKPMKVDLKSCSLNDIVNKTLRVVEAELRDKGIVLEVNLASSLPNVFADGSLMEQSLLNLVKNAMQAIDKERRDGCIVVSSFLEADMVKISVRDNGCGMTQEQMSKIFEPYYTTKSAGTGLGLTVLYKIMKQHGGDVVVHSEYGEGSEFILQIPVPSTERYRIDYNGGFEA